MNYANPFGHCDCRVHYGPIGIWREPTAAEIARGEAVKSLIDWYDLEKMAVGLRHFYRYDRFREHRARAMKANPPKFARWWNR